MGSAIVGKCTNESLNEKATVRCANNGTVPEGCLCFNKDTGKQLPISRPIYDGMQLQNLMFMHASSSSYDVASPKRRYKLAVLLI